MRQLSDPTVSFPSTVIPFASNVTPLLFSPKMSSEDAGMLTYESTSTTGWRITTLEFCGNVTFAPAEGIVSPHVDASCQSRRLSSRWGQTIVVGLMLRRGGSGMITTSFAAPEEMNGPDGMAFRSTTVGASVGRTLVGVAVVGFNVGARVGERVVGFSVGVAVVGFDVDATVGERVVGLSVGLDVGFGVVFGVGLAVGFRVVFGVGLAVASFSVGLAVAGFSVGLAVGPASIRC